MSTNTILKLALAAAALTQTHTAPSPPAYFIAEVNTRDVAQMKRYGSKVPETLAPFKGHFHYVILDGHPQSLEGTPPEGGIVVIAFDSIEVAQAWYHSPAYQAVKVIRDSAATSRIYLARGVAAPER